jgi:hypothetical protein
MCGSQHEGELRKPAEDDGVRGVSAYEELDGMKTVRFHEFGGTKVLRLEIRSSRIKALADAKFPFGQAMEPKERREHFDKIVLGCRGGAA